MKTKILALLLAIICMFGIVTNYVSAAESHEVYTLNLFRLFGHESEERIKANTVTFSNVRDIESSRMGVNYYVLDTNSTITFNCSLGYLTVQQEVEENTSINDWEYLYSSLTEENTGSCTVKAELEETPVGNRGDSYNKVLAGATISFDTPGVYYISIAEDMPALSGVTLDLFSYAEIKGYKIRVIEPLPVVAKYTDAKIVANGEPIELEVYNINDNNYFKLRDLAALAADTEGRFEVYWEQETNLIWILQGNPYFSVGGELQKGDGTDKMAVEYFNGVKMDGKIHSVKAYNINGNNYFKLRDICELLGFVVTWDNDTQTIGIETE